MDLIIYKDSEFRIFTPKLLRFLCFSCVLSK